MITVEKSIHLNKPISEVFAFMSDFANDAKWQSDLVRSEKTSEDAVTPSGAALIQFRRHAM